MTDNNDNKDNDNPTETENATAGLTSTRLRSAQPDLLLKVGDTIFQEYSQHICLWSDFIDAALASGMKETQQGDEPIELPFEKPEEWAMVRSLMAPGSSEKITGDNIDVVLPWFSYLESKQGLSVCDDFALQDMAEEEAPFDWEAFTAKLQRSIQYNLPKSKMECATCLDKFLETVDSSNGPSDPKRIADIIVCMKNDYDFRGALWPALKAFLPTYLYEIPDEELLGENLLSVVIFEAIRIRNPPNRRCSCGGLIFVKGDPYCPECEIIRSMAL